MSFDLTPLVGSDASGATRFDESQTHAHRVLPES